MNKKSICAAALIGVLSLAAAPALEVPTPVTHAAEADSFVDGSLRSFPMAKHARYYEDGDKTGALLVSHWTGIEFTGGMEGYEDISRAVSEYSEGLSEYASETRARMTSKAAEDRDAHQGKNFPFCGPYERKQDIFVRRSDSKIVSLLIFGSTYTGGVHGMYGVAGQNFNAETGERLSLSDVCPDTEALIDAIVAQLGFDYPDALFMKPGNTTMPDTVRKMVTEDSVQWVIDPRGISFYFNPYILGSYADGIFSTTILFSEHPGLFTEICCGPSSYAMEMVPHLVTRLSDSPRDHRLTVGGGYGNITVAFGGETLRDSVPISDIQPSAIECGDGRLYLLVDCLHQETGQRRIRVYDLNLPEPACIDDQPVTLLASPPDRKDERRWHVITDPSDFTVTTTEEFHGCPAGTELRCRLDPEGRLESVSPEA